MAIICPAVLALEPHEYRAQMELVAQFAQRVHIDFMDGTLTDNHSLSLEQAWWPHSLTADLHLMYHKPADYLETIIKIAPQLVIIHAEASGDFTMFAARLHEVNIKVGVALLPQTPVSVIAAAMSFIDHVLIFAGELGHFGGQPSIDEHLDKIDELQYKHPHVEIGWDGGVSDKNATQLSGLGIDVLNVGGYIQQADNPTNAYATLKLLMEQS